jgi:carboxymethylenebutenolidase
VTAERTESVFAPIGQFDMKVRLPESGHGHGVLVRQEIFGVGERIEAVAGDLTALGYVVSPPDLFWRVQPGRQGAHTELTEEFLGRHL